MKRFANRFKTVVLVAIVALGLTPAICDASCDAIQSGETKIGYQIIGPSYMACWTFAGDVNDRVLISVETTSGILYPYIKLYPPDGGPYEELGYGTIDHQLEQSGLYTIVIYDSGYDDEGTYNISLLDLPDGPLSSPQDPNGGSITSGETLSGAIDAASDADAFQFYGDVNDRVLISVETTSGTLYPYIKLYPPDGGPYEELGYETIDHQLEQSGLYTIVVYDSGYDDEGTYNISLLDVPDGPLSSPQDPNGGSITSDETLSGAIDAASDTDAFQFYGDVSDRVLISVETTSGILYPYIKLYPPDGGPYEQLGYETIDHQLEQSGLYTIVVYDSGYDDEGTYNISFLKIPPTVLPTLDVKVNGQDGPIIAPKGQKVTFSFSLDAGGLSGQEGDWGLILISNRGTFPLLMATLPITDLPEIELPPLPLPVGWWALVFILDGNPNGVLDSSLLWLDYALVIVSSPT